MSSSLKVMLVGATGLVGRHCLEELLADETVSAVTVLSRRSLSLTHPKLSVRVVDFESLRQYPALFQVDAVICSLGTTLRRAGSREAFKRVDYGYTRRIAELASQQRVRCFVLVSALGANTRSIFFYNRVKGRAEWAVRTLPFRSVYLARPSLLLGKRDKPRRREALLKLLLILLRPLLVGPLARYRAVEATRVARLLVNLVSSETLGQYVIYPSAPTGLGQERRTYYG